MYYLGMLHRNLKDVVIFRSSNRLMKKDKGHFIKILGPYSTEQAVRDDLKVLKKMYGYRENPATSERQRKFMCAELGRLKAKKKTKTGMTKGQLSDFCRKHNPAACSCVKVSRSQVVRGAKHELEHTTSRTIAKKIALDHLREDPYYYTHLAKMEKQYHKKVAHKNAMSPEKALRLTRKVLAYAKDLREEYRKNPGQNYHDQKFMRYMKELEKYVVGSQPYIATLAKAYEHLESAKDSVHDMSER